MRYILLLFIFCGCAQSNIRKTDNATDCIKEVKKAIHFDEEVKTISRTDAAFAEIGLIMECGDNENNAQLVVEKLNKD